MKSKIAMATWILMGFVASGFLFYMARFPYEGHELLYDNIAASSFSDFKAQKFVEDAHARNLFAIMGWLMLFCTFFSAYCSW